MRSPRSRNDSVNVAVLVNNAGVTADGLFIRMTDERWRSVMATNLDGAFHVDPARHGGHGPSPWGRIVNVSSVVGLDRFRRTGELRGREGGAGRAALDRWLVSWPPATSPATWSLPVQYRRR